MDNNNQNPTTPQPPQNPQPTWPPADNPQPATPQSDPLTPNFSLGNQVPESPAGTPPPMPNPPPPSFQDPAPPAPLPIPPSPNLNSNPFPPPPPANPTPPPPTPDNTFAQNVSPIQQSATQTFDPLSQPPQPDPNANPAAPNPIPLDHNIADPGSAAATPTDQTVNPIGPIDSAPTDLSHLIGNSEQTPPPDIYTPAVSTQEGPAGIPPTQPPADQTQPTEASALASGHHIGLGKILIIVGVIALLLVSGLSAYFFFGPGKNTPASQTSLPADTQAPLTNPPKQVESTPIPTFAPVATASASTSFGTLGNDSSSSGKTALDLLKSRQSVSPTPKPSATVKPSAP